MIVAEACLSAMLRSQPPTLTIPSCPQMHEALMAEARDLPPELAATVLGGSVPMTVESTYGGDFKGHDLTGMTWVGAGEGAGGKRGPAAVGAGDGGMWQGPKEGGKGRQGPKEGGEGRQGPKEGGEGGRGAKEGRW